MGLDVAGHLVRLGVLSSTSDHSSVVSINLFVALLCACIVLGHLLEENRWVNESITALIIGLCTGVVILLTTKGKSSHILVFSEDLFFIYLLPPIIFNAGGKYSNPATRNGWFMLFMSSALFYPFFSHLSLRQTWTFLSSTLAYLDLPAATADWE